MADAKSLVVRLQECRRAFAGLDKAERKLTRRKQAALRPLASMASGLTPSTRQPDAIDATSTRRRRGRGRKQCE